MKKSMVGLVMVMMLMVGCTTAIEHLDNIGKKFPNSEIFCLSNREGQYLVRTSSNEVFLVEVWNNGVIRSAKVFNSRPFISLESNK